MCSSIVFLSVYCQGMFNGIACGSVSRYRREAFGSEALPQVLSLSDHCL